MSDFAALLLAFATIYPSTFRSKPGTFDLETFRWKNRIVLIFDESENSLQSLKQIQEFLRQPEELENRQLLVFSLNTQGQLTDVMKNAILIPEEVYRAKFNIKTGQFSVILIGKDGGVKLNEPNPISSATLFGIIDAMPMRQAEMKQ